MEINFYRHDNPQGYDQSWQACHFTSDTDLSCFTTSPLVTINGQHYLRQHHVTFLTGKETCRAHHFAKHLAIQVLSSAGHDSHAGSKVLWIDTVNGPHISASVFNELAQHASHGEDIHYLCLDVLGGQQDDHWWLMRCIEQLIDNIKPRLVVIDDLDHLMPHCGTRLATEFSRFVRDTINHTETAFLLIGYNLTGKKAFTAGEIGKRLFTSSNDIFSLSTVHDVTTVRHLSGYDLSVNPANAQFRFTIGTDNLPHEACKEAAPSNEEAIVEAPTTQPGPLCRDAVAAPSTRPLPPSPVPCAATLSRPQEHPKMLPATLLVPHSHPIVPAHNSPSINTSLGDFY